MKNLLLILFSIISFFCSSQKVLYRAKKLSIMESGNTKWSKNHRVNNFIVFDVDSSYVDSSYKTKVSIYSSVYQEYRITNLVDFIKDEYGNYSFEFDAIDYNNYRCNFIITGNKKRTYFIIYYDGFAVKYLLKKKKSISYLPSSNKNSFT